MTLSYTGKKRIRKSFGKIPEAGQMPNLIEVQKSSYDQFLQKDERSYERIEEGLQAVFKSVFPIRDFSDRAVLEYVSYEFEEPKFDVEECQQRDMTYAAPLKVKLRLIVFETDEETGAKSVKDIKEQDVYLGDIPLMTDKGTFVVNGTERVIVSQMHRSPGVFFDHDKGKTHASGKLLFAARVIPYRGSWLDFEFDAKDILFVRIDRKRKLPATTLLYALGMSSEQILSTFYQSSIYKRTRSGWTTKYRAERWRGVKPNYDLVDAKTGKVVAEAGKKIAARLANKLVEDGVVDIQVPSEDLSTATSPKTSSIRKPVKSTSKLATRSREARAGDADRGRHRRTADPRHRSDDGGPLHPQHREARQEREPRTSAVRHLPRHASGRTADDRHRRSAVQRSVLRRRALRSFRGRPREDEHAPRASIPTTTSARCVWRTLSKCCARCSDLRDGRGEVDDIDNLGNRRVRSVGELMENQYRIGLLRMERAIKERMSSVDIETVMPHDLINAKPAAAAVREFFGSSQLSQFMDQTNPLSEITHKRRLSALGPGGLTRERAGFEVRDVHLTHYGRICPIETPEGPNIGLINSLATHARVNKYGFIESPYRKVVHGKPTEEIHYLSAMEEAKHKIAQANAALDDKGKLSEDLVQARENGEAQLIPRDEIDLMDVSPKQVVSVAAALIPFLENDDANRALMGSNMQRQAVPLLRADAPIVGTGMEGTVARDSGAAIAARRTGVIEQVDSQRIVVRATEERDPTKPGVDIYRLLKFQRSNQNTCITQRPIVKVGDLVREGDIVADGPSTELGELALGRNVLVAFMPWNGYNFEDSILISERIVKDDVFTSIHIEEFEVAARDTKLGPEEITRDIPNVGEEALRNLDEAGIVAIGAELEPGDILVGKVTPKGESPMTPEEKLLRAIFGEKASDVRDTSLRLPPGVNGTVVEVRVFNRHGVEKDQRALQIEREEIERLSKDRDDELAILERNIFGRLQEILVGKTAASGPKGFKKGEVTQEALDLLSHGQWWQIGLEDETAMVEIEALKKQYDDAKKRLDARFADKVDKLQRGDELPPGVMKVVKVFVAVKRKLQPGDKMAGRHGNKGVISKIVPVEDMPFLDDGTHVDIVLNPLGVPSRMNVGQILETHLGWACAGLGKQVRQALDVLERDGDKRPLEKKMREVYGPGVELPKDQEDLRVLAHNIEKGVPVATPVFDGAKDSDIRAMLKEAGLSETGQVMLRDGQTGETFKRPVTVGYIYMLKLHHLVDDKIHARSIGPYSLVTQQPLGGKAQFGGQRFGEMEVWALEAYGAAYTLQEMLTVKSDDVAGRTKVYEAITRGHDTFEAGIPESFNVLVKEMRSLSLNVELADGAKQKAAE